jgi:hypothetical protein
MGSPATGQELQVFCMFCRADFSLDWLAKLCRRLVLQLLAPERHASASGTTWSMSTAEAAYQVAPSYGLYQRPDTAAQLLSTRPRCRRV